jgi:hypothetical protein
VTALAGLVGVPAAGAAGGHARGADKSCHLARGIQHVIYVAWDNTHLLRDNPNVPSDLEQMPHLLNFLRDNGALLTNEHTPLIAHTANDIVTSETGLYPDRQGLAVANSYGYFNSDGSISFPSDFTYWTDPVQTSNTPNPPYNLITPQGKNAPAPWVAYTRAGCNFGAIASGDIALENTGTSPGGDVYDVFGPQSPLFAQAVKDNRNDAPSGLGSANFEGLAVHCAAGSAVCAGGAEDRLPDEPGGYHGFKGLFGALQVDPFLTGEPDYSKSGYLRAPALTALNGSKIVDSNGNGGFPGFDSMNPNVSLAIVAAMQEHGVPITYSYLTDAHDNQISGNGMGPGSVDYVAQLKRYDAAFARFFERLARDGITKRNTLFVFTSDEGDHFVGAPPKNAGCDGVTVPCVYDRSRVGEIDADLAPLFQAETGNTTPFDVHADSAPAFYINGNPAEDSATTRQLERDAASLWIWNPLTFRNVPLTQFLAGRTELALLHMITGDPRRTPSFIDFANPNYYLDATNQFGCPPNAHQPGCVYQYPGDAYNHGDVYPEINRTWLGLAGPGVRDAGETGAIWSDHTDDRPTILALTGLHDDYTSQGLVLTGALQAGAVPASLTSPVASRLARLYKQLEAPVGEFGLETLRASTGALAAGDPGDAFYNQCMADLHALGGARDAIAGQILSALLAAQNSGQAINPATGAALASTAQHVLQRAISTEEFCT